jgi:hypothetical protein
LPRPLPPSVSKASGPEKKYRFSQKENESKPVKISRWDQSDVAMGTDQKPEAEKFKVDFTIRRTISDTNVIDLFELNVQNDSLTQ